jgi:hypothetical protein
MKLIKTSRPGRDGTVRVTFALPADEPDGAVSVVGNFNDWDPFAHPLRRRANRTRSAAVTVPTGSTLYFRYLAEGGRWFDDETLTAEDGQGVAITVLCPTGPRGCWSFTTRRRLRCRRCSSPRSAARGPTRSRAWR